MVLFADVMLSDIKPVGDFHSGGWRLGCGWTTALCGFIVLFYVVLVLSEDSLFATALVCH